MMDEEKRKEAQRRLTDEERIRRMREGGEDMRAQLAIEEAERSSRSGERGERGNYLTPQEEQQRRMMEGSGAYRGYGETQRAELASWGQERGAGREMVRGEERMEGEGAFQRGEETSDVRVAKEIQRDWRGGQPQAGAGQERMAPTEEEMRMREQTLRETPSEQPRRAVVAPSETGGYGMGVAREGGREMAPSREVEPSRRNMSQDEMRRTGSNQVNYPAGGGSYYSETFERPTGSAGPESSFGRTEHMPSGRQYAEREGEPSEAEIARGRMGERPSPETAPTGKMGQTTGMMKEKGGVAMEKGKEYGGVAMEKGKEYGGVAMEKGKEYGTTVVAKTREVTSQLTSKAKESYESRRAEDVASRAGEALGKAIRKTVSVAREMTTGVRRGLGERREGEEEMAPRREERTTERAVEERPRMERESVQREEYTRETPSGAEKRYQEVRKKENP